MFKHRKSITACKRNVNQTKIDIQYLLIDNKKQVSQLALNKSVHFIILITYLGFVGHHKCHDNVQENTGEKGRKQC